VGTSGRYTSIILLTIAIGTRACTTSSENEGAATVPAHRSVPLTSTADRPTNPVQPDDQYLFMSEISVPLARFAHHDMPSTTSQAQ
jgi:hypothetical protein